MGSRRTRGDRGNKPVWDMKNERDIIRKARTTHSTKPESFYTMVDKLCAGRKLDYFARKERKGWEVYGNDVINRHNSKNSTQGESE